MDDQALAHDSIELHGNVQPNEISDLNSQSPATDGVVSPESGHSKELSDLDVQSPAGSAVATVAERRRAPPLVLNEYWPEPMWRRCLSRTVVSIRQILEALDIADKVSNPDCRSGPKFDDPTLMALSTEIGKIAATCPKEKDALVAAATDIGSMSAEINNLVQVYGKGFWTAEQKDSVCIHLHQWIFIKAFNTYRNTKTRDEDTKTREEDARIAEQRQHARNLIGGAAPGTTFKAESKKRPLSKGPSTTEDKGTKKLEGTKKRRTAMKPKSLKAKKGEAAQKDYVEGPSVSVVGNDTGLVGRYQIADMLVKNLYDNPTWPETNRNERALLDLIEIEWSRSPDYYTFLDPGTYTVRNTILHMWIAERRHIMTVDDSLYTIEVVSAEQRFWDMNKVRAMRWEWTQWKTTVTKDGTATEVTAKDMLCQVFADLSFAEGPRVLKMFSDGLEALESRALVLGDGNTAVNLESLEWSCT